LLYECNRTMKVVLIEESIEFYNFAAAKLRCINLSSKVVDGN
jgi:hypothetical protein